jgi:hypothetical protein
MLYEKRWARIAWLTGMDSPPKKKKLWSKKKEWVRKKSDR